MAAFTDKCIVKNSQISMLYHLKSIKEADVVNKTVLLRVDLDVPIDGSEIKDDTRLVAWFPTLQYLLEKEAEIILVGHLGRPKGVDENLSLKPIVDWIANKLQKHVVKEKIGEFDSWRITDDVSVLENIRFYKEEEENDPEFAKKLGSLAQIFVNDAFATAHRAHASTEGVAHVLPAYAGLRIMQEVTVLSKVLQNPDRPLGVVIGGAKIETKLPLVEKMHQLADYVLVGGTIVGNEEMIAKIAATPTERNCVLLTSVPIENRMDATVESMEKFVQALQNAKTIVWNGPMGKIEDEQYQKGTEVLAEGITKTQAYTILGGGDTIGFLKKKNLLDKFSFVSTGGGAMLEFLAGAKLPGLVALEA